MAKENDENVYKDIDSMGRIIAFNPIIYKNIKISKLVDEYIKSSDGKPTKNNFFQISEENFKDNLPDDKQKWKGFGWSTK